MNCVEGFGRSKAVAGVAVAAFILATAAVAIGVIAMVGRFHAAQQILGRKGTIGLLAAGSVLASAAILTIVLRCCLKKARNQPPGVTFNDTQGRYPDEPPHGPQGGYPRRTWESRPQNVEDAAVPPADRNQPLDGGYCYMQPHGLQYFESADNAQPGGQTGAAAADVQPADYNNYRQWLEQHDAALVEMATRNTEEQQVDDRQQSPQEQLYAEINKRRKDYFASTYDRAIFLANRDLVSDKISPFVRARYYLKLADVTPSTANLSPEEEVAYVKKIVEKANGDYELAGIAIDAIQPDITFKWCEEDKVLTRLLAEAKKQQKEVEKVYAKIKEKAANQVLAERAIAIAKQDPINVQLQSPAAYYVSLAAQPAAANVPRQNPFLEPGRYYPPILEEITAAPAASNEDSQDMRECRERVCAAIQLKREQGEANELMATEAIKLVMAADAVKLTMSTNACAVHFLDEVQKQKASQRPRYPDFGPTPQKLASAQKKPEPEIMPADYVFEKNSGQFKELRDTVCDKICARAKPNMGLAKKAVGLVKAEKDEMFYLLACHDADAAANHYLKWAQKPSS